jgi:hypothetical protein
MDINGVSSDYPVTQSRTWLETGEVMSTGGRIRCETDGGDEVFRFDWVFR